MRRKALTTDYGPDLVTHFLLNELRAEGHLVRVENNVWVYQTPQRDYRITLKATPIPRKVRLRETD